MQGFGLSLLSSGDNRSKLSIVSGNYFDYLCGYATAFNECIKVGFPVELSTTNYLQIGCHMNTLFRRQVVSYLGSGVLFSTKGPSECILTYAHLKWT
jgi:hypothetical protein